MSILASSVQFSNYSQNTVNPDPRVQAPWIDDPYVGTRQIASIAESLRLFVRDGEVVELRALKAEPAIGRQPTIVAGYFDSTHIDEMAAKAFDLTTVGRAEGVYFTLNPLLPDVLARCANRAVPARTDDLSSDKDVLRRARLLIDVDPFRPTGISASASEKERAKSISLQIREFLDGQGWPKPIFADSGNGFHLLYDIDLPVGDGGLVKRVLVALAARFDTPDAKVDTRVFNPARIVKLYGTRAQKGDDTPDRPHRYASILEVPSDRQPVAKELLETIANSAPVAPTPANQLSNPNRQDWLLPDRDSTFSRARAYLAKVPGAIAGEAGHDATFKTACILVKGFGLSPDEALPLFREWNQTCQPSWSDKELLHKLNDAAKADGPSDYLLQQPKNQQTPVLPSMQYAADFIDSAAFDALEIKHEWLIRGIMVANQPAIVGGPKKSLKTSLMIDLAISLGSGSPFLGNFDVPRHFRVAVMSGESGQATLQSTARRVCRTKGVALRNCDVLWGFRLPRLSHNVDLQALGAAIVEKKIEVVVIDPLYLCLLSGNAAGVQAGNLYDMGPLLLRIAQTCLDAGATPILVHHTTKSSRFQAGRETFEPLDLDALAFAGVAEFARQWLIVSRREAFDADEAVSKLWMNVGGSAGHCGLYGLDIREGIADDLLGGREWNVTVKRAKDVRNELRREKEASKDASKRAQEENDMRKVFDFLMTKPLGETIKAIAMSVGISEGRARQALVELAGQRVVATGSVVKACGRNKEMRFDGWRLCSTEQRFASRDGQSVTPAETIAEVGMTENRSPDRVGESK